MAKAAVLIDGAYYEKVRLEFGRPNLDLVAMSDKFAAPAERLRTYYYDALPWVGDPPDPRDVKRRVDKQHYFESLKLLDRMEIRQGRVQRRETRCTHGTVDVAFGQKLVDVKLSVELARLAWSGQIERAILLSGDSDFVPAVEAAKDAGVVVKLLFARRGRAWAHDELIKASDERVEIDEAFVKTFTRQESTRTQGTA